MQDVEIIGMLKSYVKTTLVGMGALKGAPCQCVIATNQDGTHTVTMKWVDNEGDEHTDSFTVLNGQVGAVEDISDVQVTNIVNGQVLAWDSTAGKWVNVTNSASVASLANIGDVQFTALADGEVLTWDDTAGKWKNKAIPVDDELSNSSENPVQNKVIFAALEDKANISDLGTAAAKDSTNAVTQNSVDLVESGAVYTELSGKADKATTLDGYGITNAYTKTETDSAIATEIGKLDSSDSAVAGSYVTAVSEADGKTTVTREAGDNTPTASSNKMVKSGGVYSALSNKADKGTSLADYGITNAYTKTETDSAISTEIGKLDVSDSATAGAYVTAVSETNGKISVTRETADTTPTANSKKMLTSGGAKAALDEKQNTLTFDNAPTENSNNPVKSGGVYSADANIYAEMTRQGVKNILSQQFDEVMITASLGNKATSANGLTLTYNSDGSIKINGIPTDSSKNVAIRFDWDTNNHPIDISYLAGKKIVASISKTEINGIKIIPGYFDASDGAHHYSGADITTKGEYTYSNDAKWGRCYMSISGAYSYSNVTVYPMIYIPFEGATDDYAPPTKTNQELTEEQGYFTDDQWAAVTALLT